MTDIVTRLQNPPFGTETSERNLMSTAAAEIITLRDALGRAVNSHAELVRLLIEWMGEGASHPSTLVKRTRAALDKMEQG